MLKIIEAWKKLAALLADRKITKDEVPDFLAALGELTLGLFELVCPFLTGGAADTARKIADGLVVAGIEAKK